MAPAHFRIAQNDVDLVASTNLKRRASLVSTRHASPANFQIDVDGRQRADIGRRVNSRPSGKQRDERERSGNFERADAHLPVEIGDRAEKGNHRASNFIRVFPKRSSSPSRSNSDSIRRPLTNVPFVEPRSRTTALPSVTSTTA